MKMKLIIAPFAILLVSAISSSAQKGAALPDRAVALKKSYQEARQRALRPVVATYKTELAKLLEDYAKAGKLDEALAVRKKIDSLTGEVPQTKEASKFKSSIADTQWVWAGGPMMTFYADGRAELAEDSGAILFKYTWVQKSPRVVQLTQLTPPNVGQKLLLNIAGDLKNAIGTGGGKRWKAVREESTED